MGDLANKVRAKYPGAYNDMSDQQLEAAVIAKYPEYKDLAAPSVPTLTNQAPQQASQPSFATMFGRTMGAPTTPEEAGGMLMGKSGAIEGEPDSVWNPPGGMNLPGGFNPGNAARNVATNLGDYIAQRIKGGAKQFTEAAENVRHGQSIPANVGKAASGYGDIISAVNPAVNAGGESGKEFAKGNIPGGLGAFTAGMIQGTAMGAGMERPTAPELPRIPSLKRASANFQEVMGAAKNKTVPITDELSGALSRYQELVDRGGSRSLSVSKLLNRVTNPDAPPMTYGEARDFASNISRLSADEFMRLTPQMKQQVGAIRVALNNAVGQTAESVGKGAQYQSAMKEYSKAAQINQLKQQATDVVLKKVLPAAGYGILAKKAYDVFGK